MTYYYCSWTCEEIEKQVLIFTTGVLVELPMKVSVCAEQLVIGDAMLQLHLLFIIKLSNPNHVLKQDSECKTQPICAKQ